MAVGLEDWELDLNSMLTRPPVVDTPDKGNRVEADESPQQPTAKRQRASKAEMQEPRDAITNLVLQQHL